MPSDRSERPQDVDRNRRRRGSISPATAELLAMYRDSLRTELAATLTKLADGKLATDERIALMRLARQTAAELREGDDIGDRLTPGAAVRSSLTRPPRLSARDRAALER